MIQRFLRLHKKTLRRCVFKKKPSKSKWLQFLKKKKRKSNFLMKLFWRFERGQAGKRPLFLLKNWRLCIPVLQKKKAGQREFSTNLAAHSAGIKKVRLKCE